MARAKYKHMFTAESKMWDMFLIDHQKEYIHFEYDVHVGKLWGELLTMEEPYLSGAASIYLRRIDVVGYQPDLITVFEVKPHAGLSALGQVLGYIDLFIETYNPTVPVAGAVVTSLIDPNIEHLFELHGIDIYKYPWPTDV